MKTSLEKDIARTLIRQSKTVAAAESCTGGLLSHRLTNIPGSSVFFKGTVVAYANTAKQKILRIPGRVLARYGAVSAPIARRMAKNVRTLFNADYGIGITGIAGPTGATTDKPVGLTYIAVSARSTTRCYRRIFAGSRSAVKSSAATEALRLVRKSL